MLNEKYGKEVTQIIKEEARELSHIIANDQKYFDHLVQERLKDSFLKKVKEVKEKEVIEIEKEEQIAQETYRLQELSSEELSEREYKLFTMQMEMENNLALRFVPNTQALVRREFGNRFNFRYTS